MNLKSFMQRIGISQTELAKKLDVTQAAISYWSSGTNSPSLDIAKKLIFLGMTTGELFDAETELFLSKKKSFDKKKLSADIVETALSALVNGEPGKITDRDACTQIVKIGLEELFGKKRK